MKFILIITTILLPFFLKCQNKEALSLKGFITYEDKYAKSQSIFTYARKITTIFGPNEFYVSYITNYIRNEKEYALACPNPKNESDVYQASLDAAIRINKLYSNRIAVAYEVNSKTRVLNSINYFYYIKEKTCYLIDTTKPLNFNIIDSSSKVILGYNCKKMILKTQKGTYDIWYTEDLPYNIGPLTFFGAPGAILEVDAPDIKIGYLATEISTSNMDKLLIKTIPVKHDNLLVNKEGYLKILAKDNAARGLITE